MRAWLVLHVLAAIAGMGPEMAFGIMGPWARHRDPQTAVAVYAALGVARRRLVYPALALQVVSGTVLITLGRHSILQEGWLLASLVLYAVAILLVAGVLVPGSARAVRLLAEGVPTGDPRLRHRLVLQSAAGGAAGLLLVAVAVLMVWKPGS